jgi:hypothetical protein
MAMEGFFNLRTPEDLLCKLEWEYTQWQKDRLNTYVAWNFFVTAEHLPDWLARTDPLALKGYKIEAFKQSGQLTRICSHLANGGKHFRATRHTAVASTRQQGGWIPLGWVPDGWVPLPVLLIDLTPDEQDALQFPSASIEALLFATWLLAFWQTYPALQPRP